MQGKTAVTMVPIPILLLTERPKQAPKVRERRRLMLKMPICPSALSEASLS
mgnify:CR=1 FL=1